MEGAITDSNTQSNPWGSKSTSSQSPWQQKVGVVPCSLEEVMSEQLASELQQAEETTAVPQTEGTDVDPGTQALIDAATSDPETSSDMALARALQAQFDQEHNQMLKQEEKQYNGTNKVTISFDNYKSHRSQCQDDEDDDDDDDEITATPDEDVETPWDERAPTFNGQGIAGKGKNITTKHDKVICGRKNASKMMEFPPEFMSGDGEGMDMQLPNHVYNKLKRHSDAENRRNQRLHEKKEHSTAEHAMDPRTRLLLYKMVNSGTLDSISGSISTGKESVVFHAFGGQFKDVELAKEVAIKVFKTTLNEFKTREKYVHGDHRFSKDDYKKQNPRKIIKMWAMKETANLNRMRKFDIPCPRVQLLRNHVLVMTFIGENRVPAPKLKDTRLSTQDKEDAYEQVISIMTRMYRECGLVHADFSEYNLLWYQDKVWVIDVSQAVDLTHPRALQFLHRDCTNVSKFFTKIGVHKVMTPETLFNKVTELGIKGEGEDFLAQVQRYDKEKREELLACQASSKVYAFDYFFEKSVLENSDFNQLVISDSESDEDEEEGEVLKEEGEVLKEEGEVLKEEGEVLKEEGEVLQSVDTPSSSS